MNQVKAIKKLTTSGVRLPSYWGELISLIDAAPDAGAGATMDDCDDEDAEADGTQAQIKAQSGEQKEQNIQGFCELEREAIAKKTKLRRPGSRLLRISLHESDPADEKQPDDPPRLPKLERRLHVTSRCSGSRKRPRRPIAKSRTSQRPTSPRRSTRTLAMARNGSRKSPWLSLVEDENTSKEPAQVVCEVTKKPVTERKIPMRRPAVAFKTTEWHREHTRVYYLAKKEYEVEVLAGKRKDYEEQRRKFEGQRTAEAKAKCRH